MRSIAQKSLSFDTGRGHGERLRPPYHPHGLSGPGGGMVLGFEVQSAFALSYLGPI